MLEKKIIDFAFGHIKTGAVKVTYWDGESKIYGVGKPYFAMTIKDPVVIRRMRQNPTLAFGEAYMDGLIDIKGDLVNIGRIFSENYQAVTAVSKRRKLVRRRHFDTRSQKKYVQSHYDLGNDFYKLWLDRSMTYSCAYFKQASDPLEQAQSQKIDHLLRKLQLKRGMTLLDIGCGWGELIIRAAKEYGVKATGITLSQQQYKAAKARIKKERLSGKVEVKLSDYRDLASKGAKFDRVVSVGMFEHVGQANQQAYFKAVHDMLPDGGISVLHTITTLTATAMDPWIDKYIFPGGYIPAWSEVIDLLPQYDFHMTDYESLRIHYAMTLDEWSRRFERHLPQVRKMYDERFVRMWRLYLRSSAAGFRYGDLDLSQIVFTKGLDNHLPLTREHIYAK